jgi:hypothetical protein
MKTAKRLFIAALVAGSIALANPHSALAAEKSGQCGLVGTWFGKNSLGVKFLETITPLEPNNNSVSLLLNGTGGEDPTFGGLFPTAVSIGAFQGEGARSGTDAYKFTAMSAGKDANHQIVYFLKNTGTKSFSDCNTYTVTGELQIFLASQDRDGSGFATAGETPVVRIPYSCILHRMNTD